MPKDLCSVYLTETKKRVWSFMSLAGGLMVDLDIGTENIRWMGDIRFTLGFIRGVASSSNHKCRLKMKVVAEDKVEMARSAREWAKGVVGEKVVGGGMDPLVNGVKKLSVEANGTSGNDQIDGTTETVLPEMGDNGPLPPADSLDVDERWKIIETGTKSSPSQVERDAKAASTGQSGGWIDGEGILYV